MAINLITQPDAATPTGNDDYTQQNILINGNLNHVAPEAVILSVWATGVSAPAIKQGTFIRHAGNMYSVDSSDEAISGSPASGINYIKLTVSGTTLLASWVNVYSGYAYNPAYNGWYSGTDQIIFQGVYLSGADYISAQGVNNDPDKFRLSNGDFRYLAGSVYVDNIVSCANLSTPAINSAGGDMTVGTAASTTNVNGRLNVTASTGLEPAVIVTGTLRLNAYVSQQLEIQDINGSGFYTNISVHAWDTTNTQNDVYDGYSFSFDNEYDLPLGYVFIAASGRKNITRIYRSGASVVITVAGGVGPYTFINGSATTLATMGISRIRLFRIF